MLDFTIELKRSNELLERIAVAAERIAGPDITAQPFDLKVIQKTEAQHIGRVDLTGEKKTLERLRKYGA